MLIAISTGELHGFFSSCFFLENEICKFASLTQQKKKEEKRRMKKKCHRKRRDEKKKAENLSKIVSEAVFSLLLRLVQHSLWWMIRAWNAETKQTNKHNNDNAEWLIKD